MNWMDFGIRMFAALLLGEGSRLEILILLLR
jgi:hypothetical protein